MFAYEKNILSVVQPNRASTSLATVATQEQKPFYIYDLDGILARLQLLQKHLPQTSIHFAMKSNNTPEILQALAKNGAGVDVVSEGEFRLALKCGFAPEKTVFSGVAKTVQEIRFALKSGVKQLNIESLPELERVAFVARELNVKAPVALRMNPDVDANTHPYIRTGFRENKFGLDFSEIETIAQLLHNNPSHLNLCGLALHIGSQIREIAPFAEAIEKTKRLNESLERQGFKIKTFDIGGGLGIDYHSEDINSDERLLKEYAAKVLELTKPLKDKGIEILTEPGRFLVARFGVLVGEVQYLKQTPFKTFAILNTGMHHLMRPALYEAYHRILPLRIIGGDERLVDVVGPICESTDTIGHERLLPAQLKAGDYLAIMDAGAYGAVMASHYNLHDMPKQIVVSEGRVL